MLLDQVSYIKVAFNIMINGKVIYNRIPNASRTNPERIPKESRRKTKRLDTKKHSQKYYFYPKVKA